LILLLVPGPTLAIAVTVAAAEGTFMCSDLLWDTTLQQHVRPETIARVTSFDYFGSLVLLPIGYALVGPIAESVGFETTLWAASIGLALIAVFLVAVPSIRNLESRRSAGSRAPNDELAEPAA
jgi:hypothetical protein